MHNGNDADLCAANPETKDPWTPPQLTVYGDLRTITQSGDPNPQRDSLGGSVGV